MGVLFKEIQEVYKVVSSGRVVPGATVGAVLSMEETGCWV